MKRTDLAYTAGIIDAELALKFQKRKASGPNLSVEKKPWKKLNIY